MEDLHASKNQGYPAAKYAIATTYYLGDDIPQDFEIAERFYTEAYNEGVIWAAWGLYILYSDVGFEGKDLKKADKWKSLFLHRK